MTNYRWLITIATIIISLTGLFAYKDSLIVAHAEQNKNMGEPTATIEAIHVAQISYQKTISVNGVNKAMQTIQVSNELAGKITKLNFSSGALVNKGQVLLEQDYSQESAQLIAARAKVLFQQKIINRYKVLQKKEEISDERVDKAIMELRISESEVAVLESIISKKIIRTPFKAKAGIHNLQVGQHLEGNSQIAHLIGVSKYSWIDFYVPQVYDELSVGSEIAVSLGDPEPRSTNAKIVSVEPMLTNESRQFKYRAQVTNEKLALKHNHLVKVTLPVTNESLKIAIPSLAVNKDPLGDYVFMIKPEEDGVYRAHRHKVELGDRMGDQVIVKRGLVVGDYIANTGAFKLRPGLKVFVSSSENDQMVSTL